MARASCRQGWSRKARGLIPSGWPGSWRILPCLAGATGWAGSALARAIAKSEDMKLVSAISRTHAGHVLGEVLGEPLLNCPIYATAGEALAHQTDVFFEFSKPEVAKSNVLAALQQGAQVVIGTSGLTDADYSEIASVAGQRQLGVLGLTLKWHNRLHL